MALTTVNGIQSGCTFLDVGLPERRLDNVSWLEWDPKAHEKGVYCDKIIDQYWSITQPVGQVWQSIFINQQSNLALAVLMHLFLEVMLAQGKAN